MEIETLINRIDRSARSGAREEAAADLHNFLKDDRSGRRAADLFRNVQNLVRAGEYSQADLVLGLLGRIGRTDHAITILSCCVAEKLRGAEGATSLFRQFVSKNPVFRHQHATAAGAIRVGNLLNVSHEKLRFSADGFKIPQGLTESFHLLRSPGVDASLIFYEGMTGTFPDEFDVVVNSISDADTFEAELLELSDIARRSNPAVINVPRPGSTRRDAISAALAGTPEWIVPRTIRVSCDPAASPLSVQIADEGMTYPVLLRPVGSQTGAGLTRLDTSGEAGARRDDGVYYVTEYRDFRSHDGYFRKYRAWHIGGKVLANHLFLSPDWNVHGTSRKATMIRHRWMRLEEEALLEKPIDARVTNLAAAIREVTGLDYFGIDYGYMPDGAPILFEANATMRSHYPEWYGDFPYVEAVGKRHVAAFQEMLRVASRARKKGLPR